MTELILSKMNGFRMSFMDRCVSCVAILNGPGIRLTARHLTIAISAVQMTSKLTTLNMSMTELISPEMNGSIIKSVLCAVILNGTSIRLTARHLTIANTAVRMISKLTFSIPGTTKAWSLMTPSTGMHVKTVMLPTKLICIHLTKTAPALCVGVRMCICTPSSAPTCIIVPSVRPS